MFYIFINSETENFEVINFLMVEIAKVYDFEVNIYWSTLAEKCNIMKISFSKFHALRDYGIKFIIIIIIISLTSIFFQDKSRVWTAASQQH